MISSDQEKIIRECYESASFEMVECSETLSIPSSQPAVFEFERDLNRRDFRLLIESIYDNYPILGSFEEWKGSQGYWRGNIGSADTRCKIKITNSKIRVYPEREEFVPFTWFQKFYETVSESVECGVHPVPQPSVSAGDEGE